MSFRNSLTKFKMLSELYRQDASAARLLAEYPSSNSKETQFRNATRFVIHDPFPPPQRSLMKVLGPHHLMCCWGNQISVTSEIGLPGFLTDHWRQVFGEAGCPNWMPLDRNAAYITLYPHESLEAENQVVDPQTLHELHSKEVIGKIDCPQAAIFDSIEPPCIVKLSHGYAGLGNYLVRNKAEQTNAQQQIDKHWPDARLVINEIIENVVGDFGVQFYLRRDGTFVQLGLTEQKFDEALRWSGGHFVLGQQDELYDSFHSIVEPTAQYLHHQGYFGVVGVDVLVDKADQSFLVDVNPRLTGITPFLIASRLFVEDGFHEGIYQAGCVFPGNARQLIECVEKQNETGNSRGLVLAAWEDSESNTTRCHLSVSSHSIQECEQAFQTIRAS